MFMSWHGNSFHINGPFERNQSVSSGVISQTQMSSNMELWYFLCCEPEQAACLTKRCVSCKHRCHDAYVPSLYCWNLLMEGLSKNWLLTFQHQLYTGPLPFLIKKIKHTPMRNVFTTTFPTIDKQWNRSAIQWCLILIYCAICCQLYCLNLSQRTALSS